VVIDVLNFSQEALLKLYTNFHSGQQLSKEMTVILRNFAVFYFCNVLRRLQKDFCLVEMGLKV